MHHTLALFVGSHGAYYLFTPPSANASDGDSDTTEPSALRYLNCIGYAFFPLVNSIGPQ